MIWRLALLGFFLSLSVKSFKQPFDREILEAERFVADASLLPDSKQTVAFGRALLRRTKDISKSAVLCGQLRGCDTGIMIEAANQIKFNQLSGAKTAGRLEEEFCSKSPQNLMCWYNLGQGFYDLTSGDIEKSAGFCKNLHNKDENAFKHCAGGVFRRWFLAEDGTRALCSNYPEYIHQCVISVIEGRWESLRHVD